MTESRWHMEGLTFTIALEALGRDRLPYPLSYFPDPIEFPDDLDRSRAAAAQRLKSRFDDRLHNALTVLLEPEMRIEVYGFYGPDQTRTVRMHAGITGDTTTLAIQSPGPTRDYGTDVTITTHPTELIAHEIITRLPRLPAGTHRPFHGKRSDLTTPINSRDPIRLSPIEEFQRFFHRPRIGMGEISVFPGYTVDSRPTKNGHGFLWLDYPDDGRYLLTEEGSDEINVVGGAPGEQLRQLQSCFRETLRARAGI
ncbi:ESX secretion-associated protein EspG [Nocardia fluminea]|uniref:ESX secretion-associated protein EspG n=1 Tax=Nocardia fluminea TaxID=134984 RepID=UPI00366C5EE7